MTYKNNFIKFLVSYSKSYGFIFASSEIYDGLGSIYDYAHNGVLLKNNIKEYWFKSMTQLHKNIISIDSSILTHKKTLKSSGHIENFNDFFIDNNNSKHRYRVDFLIQHFIKKKVTKKIKQLLNNNFDKNKYVVKINQLIKYKKTILKKMFFYFKTKNCIKLKQLITNLHIKDPITHSDNWSNVFYVNLMFKTHFNITSMNPSHVYLRPETAQGVFINFNNLQKTSRLNIPFGVAQIGKSFRNEFIAKQFIFRMREFEQMEMQFFINPTTENTWYNYWKNFRFNWYTSLGLNPDLFRFKNHKELSHYCSMATDIEFKFPFGFKELEGIHSRTDFDLKNHEKYSNKKFRFFDIKHNRHYIPYVIETSLGLDRLFLSILCSSLKEELLPNTNNYRLILKIHPALSPIKAAILPLVKKHHISELSLKIFNELKIYHQLYYDDNGSIGKRYRRQDAIGTPICVTVDYKSLTDDKVTIRLRDSMLQKRVSIKTLNDIISLKTNLQNLLTKIKI